MMEEEKTTDQLVQEFLERGGEVYAVAPVTTQ